MKINRIISQLSLIFLLIIANETGKKTYRFAEGAKRRIQITDDLDDVVDDEEDESWKEWGKKKKSESKSTSPEFDPPPEDFSKMDPSQMQAEMLKRQFGPVFGFVKLRLGSRRTPEMVSEIAMKWTNVARTGGIEVKFMRVDISTIMFTMEKGQDTIELKEFLLSQADAYEVKMGDQLFRRPGDPPFEKVFEDYQIQKSHGSNSQKDHTQDEL
ncbi:hypothetical protein M9H77_33233 [Catharanthus roseus]|uniref:Uncharacterized protein n=1 Tax=Catharanthus roseus TaxID=4058 RepID=A0ACB9ZJK3_CATRO|nr:hypothetical protein M9H77_33233 [Catharanthus roseus]